MATFREIYGIDNPDEQAFLKLAQTCTDPEILTLLAQHRSQIVRMVALSNPHTSPIGRSLIIAINQSAEERKKRIAEGSRKRKLQREKQRR